MQRILECIESCRMTEHLIPFFPKLEQFDPKTKEFKGQTAAEIIVDVKA